MSFLVKIGTPAKGLRKNEKWSIPVPLSSLGAGSLYRVELYLVSIAFYKDIALVSTYLAKNTLRCIRNVAKKKLLQTPHENPLTRRLKKNLRVCKHLFVVCTRLNPYLCHESAVC